MATEYKLPYTGTELSEKLRDIDNNKSAINTITVSVNDHTSNEDVHLSSTEKEKLSSIESGAQVNIQSDYAQNDETKNDYIKNRTHYEISRANDVLVDNVAVSSFAKDGDNDWYVSAENPFDLTISDEKKYTVIFDGIEYECYGETHHIYKYNDNGAVNNFYGWYCIGNSKPIQPNAQWTNTEYPFCITIDYYKNSGEVQVFVYNNNSTSHTISIIDITPVTQKIPMEYMPEEMVAMKKGSGKGSVALATIDNINIASGEYSVAIGVGTQATSGRSFAQGSGTVASGNTSHAEGNNSVASGNTSHAEGWATSAKGYYSHSEGLQTTASGNPSHAQGYRTTASGDGSHAEGYFTTASANRTHAEGNYTIANSTSQHVQGEYNIADTPDANNKNKGKYLHIVGNGTAENARSNAHTLDWDGNGWFAGTVKVGGTSYDDAEEVALKSDILNVSNNVDEKMKNITIETKIRGVDWTTNISGDPLLTRTRIAYDGYGKYVALCSNGKIQYSSDGRSWNYANNREVIGVFNDITYGNGLFVAIGSNNNSAYSSNGIDWTVNSSVPVSSKSITYGKNTFVVDISGYQYYSNDGINWERGDLILDGLGCFTYGKDKFIAAATSSKIYYSTSGSYWNVAAENIPVHHLAYGNDIYVGIGNNNGIAAYSSDGTTWTTATIPKCSFNSVIYGNGVFIAFGEGYTYISTDGKIWDLSLDSPSVYNDIICGKNNDFIAVGERTVSLGTISENVKAERSLSNAINELYSLIKL